MNKFANIGTITGSTLLPVGGGKDSKKPQSC